MKRPLLLPLLALAAVPCLAQDPATNAVVQIPMEAFEKDADWRSFVPAGFMVSPSDAHLELGGVRGGRGVRFNPFNPFNPMNLDSPERLSRDIRPQPARRNAAPSKAAQPHTKQ